jgi:hypothetical protein
MATQESHVHRYLIWLYLVGVLIVTYLILKVIMWMDGVK